MTALNREVGKMLGASANGRLAHLPESDGTSPSHGADRNGPTAVIKSLSKMDQLKSDFVSMVAHEIRSPLNSVAIQLKVILDGLAGDVAEKQHEILSRAILKIEALLIRTE